MSGCSVSVPACQFLLFIPSTLWHCLRTSKPPYVLKIIIEVGKNMLSVKTSSNNRSVLLVVKLYDLSKTSTKSTGI